MTPIVIFFCISMAFLVFAGQVPPMPYGLILMLFAVIFAAAGISEYWRYIRLTNAEVRKRNKVAERNSDIEYVNAVERMTHQVLQATPEQAKIISSLTAIIICEAGSGDPIWRLRIADTEWDWDTVSDFVRQSKGPYLAAVGEWSEGSPGRSLAQKATALLIARGLAEPAAGNRPARWVDRAGGLRAIGMEE